MIVEVDTPAFSGRFIHPSETSSALRLKARSEADSYFEECKNYLQLCLVDRNQVRELEELERSEVIDIYKSFRSTKPTRLEIPNEVPAWL